MGLRGRGQTGVRCWRKGQEGLGENEVAKRGEEWPLAHLSGSSWNFHMGPSQPTWHKAEVSGEDMVLGGYRV